MLYKFIRRFLFLLDSEVAHNLIIFFLSFPPIRCFLHFLYKFHDPSLERAFLGIYFKNPIGLAAGFDKNAKALLAWEALGFGFVEVGTVTPKPQKGNEKPRILRFVKEKALVNWMGFPNQGIDKVLKRIKKAKPKMKIPIGLNIGKNADTSLERAIDDYMICIEKGNPWVDFFVINISSPNTPELRKLHEPKYLNPLLNQLYRISKHPLFLKLSPDLTDQELFQVLAICRDQGIKGIIATNTSTDYRLLSHHNLSYGGVSGVPLKEKSNDMLRKIKSRGIPFTIIGVGGISSAQDVQDKIKTGADLMEIYTGLIFEGPGLIKKILKNMI